MSEILSAERVVAIQQAVNKWREGPAMQQRRVYLEMDAAVAVLADAMSEVPSLQQLHAKLQKELATTQDDLQREKGALADAKGALARFIESAKVEQKKISDSLKAEHDDAVKVRADRLAEWDQKIAAAKRKHGLLEEAANV